VFVSLGIYFEICPAIYPEICHAGKNIKKIMVSQNLCQAHLLEVWLDGNSGRPRNLIHSPPCRILCRLFIHEVFFEPLKPPPSCEVNLDGRSPPFRPMRALRLQWSRAFSLVCEVALSIEVLPLYVYMSYLLWSVLYTF
jgi:hypothetical protein